MKLCTIICCIGYGAAAWQDEKEGQVPRLLSYFVCAWSLAAFVIQWKKGAVIWGSMLIFWGFFLLICMFWKKGLLGRADVYMIFSMLLLLSLLGDAEGVLFGEALFFALAFAGAGARMICTGKKEACPLILPLFAAFLCSRLLIHG